MTRDMTVLDLDELRAITHGQPYPLLFVTVSGAHLYGFPSRDSDVDLRGAHLLPIEEVVGLRTGRATIDTSWEQAGAEIDLVTHDAFKFFRLLLSRNGYVLEQLLSPIVVSGSPAYEELRALGPDTVTRHHAHHYRGFAQTQRRMFEKSGELKPLLYTFRAYLTGVHLMRSGALSAHLPTLAGLVPEAPGYLGELIAAKTAGEHRAATGVGPDRERLDADLAVLEAALEEARASTRLPERPGAENAVHDLLVRLRTGR
ncbi:nucleotidyltransferase domain-containing protein [Catenuloplanes japonicus]|uniref:nucleotidyltransferase domain-containing protein n=1 Tax=Catenuloplanes japonicus TaxID=33876 RepID=UPI000AC303CA|nr:nucleotidyltransferase domain-containing protein [Catenuloplanes japonicus]